MSAPMLPTGAAVDVVAADGTPTRCAVVFSPRDVYELAVAALAAPFEWCCRGCGAPALPATDAPCSFGEVSS